MKYSSLGNTLHNNKNKHTENGAGCSLVLKLFNCRIYSSKASKSVSIFPHNFNHMLRKDNPSTYSSNKD